MKKVILIGRLGSDPEIKFIEKKGILVAKFRVATNEVFNNNGKKEVYTEWHKVVAFGKVAEVCKKITKGMKVYIEGKFRTIKFDYQNTKGYIVIVIAQKILILSKPKSVNDGKEGLPRSESVLEEDDLYDINDDC